MGNRVRRRLLPALFCAIASARCVQIEPPAAVLVGNTSAFRRMHTPELSTHAHVGEEFNMNADGLTAIDVWPVRVGEPRGTIRLQIGLGTPGHQPAVRGVEVPAEDFVRASSYRFRFTPFDRSRNEHFTLDIAASADDPPSGVAVWATKGIGNQEDVLTFNGEARFGDLVYQTDIVRPPAPPPAPPFRRAVWYALAVLACGWLFAVLMLRRLRAALS